MQCLEDTHLLFFPFPSHMMSILIGLWKNWSLSEKLLIKLFMKRITGRRSEKNQEWGLLVFWGGFIGDLKTEFF